MGREPGNNWLQASGVGAPQWPRSPLSPDHQSTSKWSLPFAYLPAAGLLGEQLQLANLI